jgi:polyhydroxyalkanoate synthesis regulator phasin
MQGGLVVGKGKSGRSSESRVGAIHELPLLWIPRRLPTRYLGFKYSLATIKPPCLVTLKMGVSPLVVANGDTSTINQILTTIMTQSNDQPNDRRIDRQLRTINRRVNRLEDTQVTWGELNVEFDRLYDEVDELKAEVKQQFAEVNTKLDIIIRQMTGMGQE